MLAAILRRVDALIAEAGFANVSWKYLLGASLGLALISAMVVQLLFGVSGLALLAMLASATAPYMFLKGRARRRHRGLSEVWPNLLELIRASIRAGETMEDALADIATAAPAHIAPFFEDFGKRIQQGWSFTSAINVLRKQLADPISDQVLETLKIAKTLGGAGLGGVLERLSQTVRADVRLLAELESRQSWHMNAAKLAAAAPWLVMMVMLLRPETRLAFTTGIGSLLIFGGAAVTIFAYRTMVRIARFQLKERWLL